MLTFKSYATNDVIWSVELNTIQEQSVGALSSSSASNDLSAMPDGAVGVIWQYGSTLANGALLTVISKNITVSDSAGSTTTATISWMDRVVWLGKVRLFAGTANLPGGANDFEYSFAGNDYDFEGYTGRGAKDAGNANVTAGNPPVPAAGASWAILVTTGLWLYVDPADDAIKLYNATGATINTPQVRLTLTAPTGKRP